MRRVVTRVLAAGSLGICILFVALVGLISQRGLWPQILGLAIAETAVPTAAAMIASGPVPTPNSSPATLPVRLTPLKLGELGTSGNWNFVIEQAAFVPDDTANGWLRGVVTYTLQNSSDRAANLDIASTAASAVAPPHAGATQPSFMPVPEVPAPSTQMSNGLRLFLVDQDRHQFGGGFGAGSAEYEVMAAPGDVIRLTYNFRYPTGSHGPFSLRLLFPASANSGAYDVRLDSTTSQPTVLTAARSDQSVPIGSWTTVGGEWRVACDGVEFGPSRGAGERPVTVHLDVENLTNTDEPALTDVGDSGGDLRDFYMTDDFGNLAYSHSDSQPGVIVPAHQSRPVMVQLFTVGLSSTKRPLIFTAMLNWQTNRFMRFRIE